MPDPVVIVLVDNNRDDVFFFQRTVTGAYGVAAAYDTTELIQYFHGEGRFSGRNTNVFPRLVITEAVISPEEPFAALKWMQSNPRWRSIPTVILSGNSSPAYVKQAFELGAKSYFSKPSGIDELKSLVDIILTYWTRSLVPLP